MIIENRHVSTSLRCIVLLRPVLRYQSAVFLGLWLLCVSSLSLLPGALQAHAVFSAPKLYRNPGVDLKVDLSPQVTTYVRLGESAYRDAAKGAHSFSRTVDAFLAQPTESNLQRARQAWISARRAYVQTEIFRFNDSPIDAPGTKDRPEGPEPRLNSWPVNEAGIDSVIGAPKSGIINATEPLTEQLILESNQRNDESDITLGWHAIEFLLWGQDLNTQGPGQRPATDFKPGTRSRDNRREYLRIATHMLARDLRFLADVWQRDSAGSYAQQLLAMDGREAIGRAMQGVTSLVSIELAGERLAVALDSGSQEDEHSCFSDTTHLDLQGDVLGVANLLFGTYEGQRIGPGLIELIRWKSPNLGGRLESAIHRAQAGAAQLHVPFDGLLRLPADSPERLQAEQTVAAMHELALALKTSAESLGLQIVVPGV